MDGKNTVCVTLENIGKLLCVTIYYFDIIAFWISHRNGNVYAKFLDEKDTFSQREF